MNVDGKPRAPKIPGIAEQSQRSREEHSIRRVRSGEDTGTHPRQCEVILMKFVLPATYTPGLGRGGRILAVIPSPLGFHPRGTTDIVITYLICRPRQMIYIYRSWEPVFNGDRFMGARFFPYRSGNATCGL